MESIWVSGASGILGYGILKALRQENQPYRLIGTTCFPGTAASKFCDLCIDSTPRTSDSNYSNWVKGFINEYNIKMGIPGIECDSQAWSEDDYPSRFPEVCFLLNNPELIKLCSDKYLFYKKLNSAASEYAIPTFEYCTKSTLPDSFIIKPRNGYGSKGISYGNSWSEYQCIIDKVQIPVIIQPCIGVDSDEYTLSAFFSYDSVVIDQMLFKRRLSSQGFTEYAEISDLDTKEFICRMGETFKPVGPTNFQFRLVEGKIKLLEINPRLSSATSMRSIMGYNEPVMSVRYFLQRKTILPRQYKMPPGTKCVRFYEDYILP